MATFFVFFSLGAAVVVLPFFAGLTTSITASFSSFCSSSSRGASESRIFKSSSPSSTSSAGGAGGGTTAAGAGTAFDLAGFVDLRAFDVGLMGGAAGGGGGSLAAGSGSSIEMSSSDSGVLAAGAVVGEAGKGLSFLEGFDLAVVVDVEVEEAGVGAVVVRVRDDVARPAVVVVVEADAAFCNARNEDGACLSVSEYGQYRHDDKKGGGRTHGSS